MKIILLGIPFFSLILALGLLIKPLKSFILKIAPFIPLAGLLTAICAEPISGVKFPWILLDSQLGMDTTGRIFLGFSSLVWLLSGIYAVSYLTDKEKHVRFFFFFLLTLTGNLGLILAEDLVTFYTFFAIMSFSAYGLVVFSATDKAREAAKVYITLVIIGEALIFTAFVLIANIGDTLYLGDLSTKIATSSEANIIIALILLGFGVKAALFSLHVWLPLAHPVAPTPASAVLSAAMIKCGLLGWIRWLPLGEITASEWGLGIILIGLLATFYAVLVGLVQDDPKTILAYSSISQMGLMTVAIGVGLKSPELWPATLVALLVYALSHALIKGALFLSVGTALMRLWRPLYLFAMLLPSLALIGAPFTAGAAAKEMLKQTAIETVNNSFWLDPIKWGLVLSSSATALLMSRFLWILWPKEERIAPSKIGMIVPWLTLVLVVALLPVVFSMMGLAPLVAFEWIQFLLIALAVFIAFTVILCGFKKPFSIPAGDILTFYLKTLSFLKFNR